jgi:hypothetical protein
MFVHLKIFIDVYFLLTAIYEHCLEPNYEHKLVKQVGTSDKNPHQGDAYITISMVYTTVYGSST